MSQLLLFLCCRGGTFCVVQLVFSFGAGLSGGVLSSGVTVNYKLLSTPD